MSGEFSGEMGTLRNDRCRRMTVRGTDLEILVRHLDDLSQRSIMEEEEEEKKKGYSLKDGCASISDRIARHQTTSLSSE